MVMIQILQGLCSERYGLHLFYGSGQHLAKPSLPSRVFHFVPRVRNLREYEVLSTCLFRRLPSVWWCAPPFLKKQQREKVARTMYNLGLIAPLYGKQSTDSKNERVRIQR